MSASIRDFIYLDEERVRSYLSQLDGCVVESKQKTIGHEGSAKGGIKAEGLTKLFLDTEAGAEYAFNRSTSETSTLHHAAFELLSSNLRKKGLMNDRGATLKPFSEIECYLRLVDYSVLGKQLDNMGLLMPLFSKVSGGKESQDDKANAKMMKNIAKVIDLLYGESKILQLVSTNGHEIIAQASLDESLASPVQNLFQASADNILTGKWKVFCIFDESVPNLNIPQPDNDISQALTIVSGQMKGLKKLISATDDAPNIIPIAIYRELS